MEYEEKEIELILTIEEEKEERKMVDDCEAGFNAGRQYCKSCGFGLNLFNKEL